MTYIKDVVQKIIDLLQAGSGLSSPSSIKDYYFGAPKSPPKRYPVIYVQFNGREPTGVADISRFLYSLGVEVGIIDRKTNEDDAEKSVYDKIEAVETVLDAHPTLDGLVVKELEPRRVEVAHAVDGDYAVTVGKIHASWRKWLP